MKLSTEQDIEAPAEYVFDCLSDFQTFEKAALRRGAEVQRVDGEAEIGQGAQWRATFNFREKPREVIVELTEFQPSQHANYRVTGQGIEAEMKIQLFPMSKARTRMVTNVQMHAKTLSARLLLQSLKLAKGQVGKRYNNLMADYARQLGKRHAKLG